MLRYWLEGCILTLHLPDPELYQLCDCQSLLQGPEGSVLVTFIAVTKYLKKNLNGRKIYFGSPFLSFCLSWWKCVVKRHYYLMVAEKQRGEQERVRERYTIWVHVPDGVFPQLCPTLDIGQVSTLVIPSLLISAANWTSIFQHVSLWEAGGRVGNSSHPKHNRWEELILCKHNPCFYSPPPSLGEMPLGQSYMLDQLA